MDGFFLALLEEAKKAESMRRSIARFSCFSCSFFDIYLNEEHII